MRRIFASLLVCTIAVGSAAIAWSADNAPKDKILVAKSLRVSNLTGLNVRDTKGEKLGTVSDLVIDIEAGKIHYIALSVGGVLGIGGKMFAVPYGEMKFDHGQDEMFFVLDMSKEKLEAAPGFDKNNWPDFADPHWSEQVDKYYREARAGADRDATK